MAALPVPGRELVRQVRICRQGIYDASRTLVAYQVRFDTDEAHGSEAVERATSKVILSTLGTFGLDNIGGGRPIFIEFTPSFLTGGIPIPLEPDQVVVVVPAAVEADSAVLEGLSALRADGYRLAVADSDADPGRDPLLALADVVVVDLGITSETLLPTVAARGQSVGAQLLAVGADDHDLVMHCQELGFKLFQGTLMQRPLVLQRQILSPTQLISARLLNDLADPDIPIGQIEQRVASDPGLSMQLLRTANSAGSGSGEAVTSLRQALVMIGPARLRSWVVLTLFEGGPAAASSDALWVVLTRAHACRGLAAADPDVAFTVGLLSGCAQLLGSEPEVVADAAGVAGSTREALLEGSGAAGRALSAVLAHELDDQEGIAASGLSPFDVSHTYLEALRAARRMVVELGVA